MKPREIVLEAIQHRDTPAVPYTLYFEGEVDKQLDAYYGSTYWRERLTKYIVNVAAVNTDIRERTDEAHERDGYGGIWRVDRLPWHLEEPPLEKPSFEGYTFPTPERFYRPDWEKEQARQTLSENPDSFILANLGWGLFERSWNLRGFGNLLMDAVTEPDFFEEALDHLMNLYLDFGSPVLQSPLVRKMTK